MRGRVFVSLWLCFVLSSCIGGEEEGFARSVPAGAVDSSRGTGCRPDEPTHICIGLKYVVFKDANGEAIMEEERAAANVEAVNKVWDECGISFQMEKFLTADPAEYSLRYRIANVSELTDVREAFEDKSRFLVATTGAWDRSGSLGRTGANAWTAMPGRGPLGIVLEQPVHSNANLISHELGHYLNLMHASTSTLLMNPIIYGKSIGLTESECQTARTAAWYFWPKMLR